jgi:hypothetical protein
VVTEKAELAMKRSTAQILSIDSIAAPGPTYPLIILVLLVILILPGAGGCQHSALAQRAIDARWARCAETLSTAVERERQGPAKLARVAAAFREDIERDEIESRENLRDLEALVEREFRRWENNQPAYRRQIGALLRGKPERIEQNAIDLFLD